MRFLVAVKFRMVFYYISHFIQIWIFPPGLNILLASIGFVLIRSQPLLATILIANSLIILWILSTPNVAYLLINYLQKQYPVVDHVLKSKDANGAIVILSGGGTDTAPEFNNKPMTNAATLIRLRYAIHLHNKNPDLKLIASGGSLGDDFYTDAQLMTDDLQEYFHERAPLIENRSITTQDEAKYIAPILHKHQIKFAYIVTHAWHMPRTMYIFKFYFRDTKVKLIAAPTGFNNFNFKFRVFNYLPSIGALEASCIALHEYVGLLSYYISTTVASFKFAQ